MVAGLVLCGAGRFVLLGPLRHLTVERREQRLDLGLKQLLEPIQQLRCFQMQQFIGISRRKAQRFQLFLGQPGPNIVGLFAQQIGPRKQQRDLEQGLLLRCQFGLVCKDRGQFFGIIILCRSQFCLGKNRQEKGKGLRTPSGAPPEGGLRSNLLPNWLHKLPAKYNSSRLPPLIVRKAQTLTSATFADILNVIRLWRASAAASP